ncbi:DNA-binding MarR family transcriptional regulator [Streptomyces olivoverticillatus]|uniref:DNA-binding MarR family transcriptional regulator n=1 Tax=Streptomyces olivoverticillatus TaxID=66427 RepID=A0A7W7LPL2_9ACTN|nr:MarR family transcriptional regulator [Streptomyces olivoverticillatus]MBB4893924.1 DNA-binding MarR family transcriptional regulator [Streptomyces olivoverticillatus]
MSAEEKIRAAMDARLGSHIKRAEQALMAEKARVLRPFGLTVPQYAALYALSLAPGSSGAALARTCAVTPQSMASLLSGLEARSLIERRPSPDHAQALITRLTPEGRVLLLRADAAAREVEAHLSAAFAPEEERQLRELLRRATEALSGPRRPLAAPQE